MRIFVAVLLAGWLAANSSTAADRKSGPEQVIWNYLDSEFASAASDPSYWHRRWHLDSALEREKIRIGRPYSDYYLNDTAAVGAFVRGGDLLESASLGVMNYPIFVKGKLASTIMVREDSLRWSFQGRELGGGGVDSIASYYAERGDSVVIVVGKPIGGLIVIRATGQSMPRARPFGGPPVFSNQLDPDGTIGYDRACALLRPEAKRWLDKNYAIETNPRK